MGKTRVLLQSPGVEVEDAEYLSAGPPPDDSQERAFEDLRSEGNQEREGMFSWVYMIPSDDKGVAMSNAKMEHLFTVPVDQLDLDGIFRRVRNEYMEATDKRWHVRVMVRKVNEGLKWNQLFVVRNSPRAADKPEESRFGEVLNGVKELVAAQQSRSDQMLERLAALAQAPRAVPEAFSMRDVLTMQQQAQQQTVTMIAAIMGAMRPQQESGGDPVEKVVKMMTSLNELRGTLGGGGGDGDGGTIGVIKALAPPVTAFMEVLAKNKQPEAAPIPGQVITQPVAAVPVAPAPTAPTQTKDEKMLADLKLQLGAMADMATSNPDPKVVAENFLKMVPEEYDVQLTSVLSGDNWFAFLTAIEPKIAPHQAWFTKVRDEILASYD